MRDLLFYVLWPAGDWLSLFLRSQLLVCRHNNQNKTEPSKAPIKLGKGTVLSCMYILKIFKVIIVASDTNIAARICPERLGRGLKTGLLRQKRRNRKKAGRARAALNARAASNK